MTYKIPEDLRFTDSHEWVRRDGNIVTIGISDYAQHELDSIQFVEFPALGKEIKKGETFGAVEAVKAAEDLICPVSGKVIERNETLAEDGKPIHEDPYGQGWLIKLECEEGILNKEIDELITPEGYKSLLEGE